MEITVKLTDEEIRDILVTAQEGGSNYWARTKRDLRDALTGETVAVYDAENPSQILGRLDRAGLDDAMNRLCRMRLAGKIGTHAFLQFFEHEQGNIGCVDASAADCFLQAALFDELVYG